MQKKIIALAIATAFAAPVSAMAAAELYGSIDVGYVSADNAGVKTTEMSSGAYNSNRWGFKGSDDLGDGMKATFQFEGGFNTASGDGANNAVTGSTNTTAAAASTTAPLNNGTATNRIFDRGIAVGISAGWGAVVLGGNQYSTSFKVNQNFDPLGYKYIAVTGMAGLANGSNGRNDNDIAYTGKFGDVTVMAGTTLNSKTDNTAQTGDARAVGVVYAAGDITAAASYTIKAFNKTAAGANVVGTEITNYSVGAAYKLGDAKVSVGYISNESEVAVDPKTTVVIGGSFKVSDKIDVAAAMYKTETGAVANSSRTLVSATYALSKKTSLYAAYSPEKTQANATAAKVDNKAMFAGLSVSF